MKKQFLAALAMFTFSAAASAQVYGVVSVGAARLDLDCAGAPTCDKTDTAFKLLGGYKFTPNVAGEIGYFDFGKGKAADPTASLDIRSSAFGGGVALHYDIAPQWNVVARVGVAQMKTKLDATVVGFGSGSDSDNNVKLYGGLGVGYKVSKTVSIDAAWDFSNSQFKKTVNGTSIDESGSLNALSLGLTFWF